MPMAKSRRVTKSRSSARKVARPAKTRGAADRRSGTVRKATKPQKATKSASRSTTRKTGSRKAAPRPVARALPKPSPKALPKLAPKVAAKAAAPPPAPPAPPQPPPRKPTYHEAVAMYERGLQALQRRDFAASAAALRNVIERYPDERELLERARLYLKVCERELEPKEPSPRTADEWVVAATVAQNSGDATSAMRHLQRALADDPRHDHAHYMMAVATTQRREFGVALEHLRRAIALNSENRSRARQDSDLDTLQDDPAFHALLDAPMPDASASKPAPAMAAARARNNKPRR
jgi:Tfp pilus assembly protein PilF